MIDQHDHPTPFTTKDGRHGVIRPMIESDADTLCRIFPMTHTESDFLNHMSGEFDLTVEQERAFIRSHHDAPGCLLICAELDGQIIGLGGTEQPKFRRYSHHCELGVTVIKAFWGQGVGRAITSYIIDWAKQQGMHKLYLKVFSDNVRAMALYQSLGFKEEGRLKDDALKADSTYRDTIIMSMFFDENS